MDDLDILVLDYQYDPVMDFTHTHQAFIGGYGSGKSRTMLSKVCLWASMNIGLTSLILGPTFSELQSYTMPDFEEMLEELDIPYDRVKSPFPLYTLHFEDGDHEVRMLSSENPERLKGFEVCAIYCDEYEAIDKKIALDTYRKAMGRLRQGDGFKFIAFYSTPNQKGFIYDHFVDKPIEGSILYHAKTEQNTFLPLDYIVNLRAAYPDKFVDAFLNGQWVNLNGERVYEEFCDELNKSGRVVTTDDRLYIGIDFNVNIMSATVIVVDDGNPIAVDEFYGDRDTQALIRSINNRYPNNTIVIYPDASGTAEKSNAESSDMAQLRKVFGNRSVIHPKANPLISTRVNCVNTLIRNANGLRSFGINTRTCPNLTKALNEQPYKNGKPDKNYQFDDCSDSLGYVLFGKFNIKKPTIKQYG